MIIPLKRMVGTISGVVLIATLSLGLAGCNGESDPASSSLEQSVAVPPAPARGPSQMVALATATSSQLIAALPGGAGLVASVRAHDYVDGFRQDILLKGGVVRSVPNSLTILVHTSRQSTLDEATPLFKPTEAAIRSELGREFPHISMQVAERTSSNGYGPYGLALGHGAGTIHCLYMWQWIDENRLPREAEVNGPMSVRIRLCQADTTFDAMAALVDHLVIGREAAHDDGSKVVTGPVAAARPASRRHVKHIARHRVHPVAEARRDIPPDDTKLGDSKSFAPAPTAPALLSGDLPPEAYLGPKAGKTATKPN